jgi:hypothetical protein
VVTQIRNRTNRQDEPAGDPHCLTGHRNFPPSL